MSLLLSDVYRFDEFELVLSSRAFSRSGTQLPLSPKAFEVLTHLVINPGRVVTKEEILKAVWPESFVEESNFRWFRSWSGSFRPPIQIARSSFTRPTEKTHQRVHHKNVDEGGEVEAIASALASMYAR
jgi:DNA-binding winged helix-turn-helix (wHTH) protein